MQPIGLGCPDFNIAVYIANIPNLPEYNTLTSLLPMSSGEIDSTGQACGNGWRKVFNIYAKLILSLNTKAINLIHPACSWQEYRDHYLLQIKSQTALLFSPPQLIANSSTTHIICGRTYAKELLNNHQLNIELNWLDHEFAINKTNRLIVCPYFDYRQLSNLKIERLSKLISGL